MAGCRVQDGEISLHHKFRILRAGECIIEGLTVHSLKRFKKEVTKVDKGMECGIAFSNLKIDLLESDVLESYLEKPKEPERFDYAPGLKQSY